MVKKSFKELLKDHQNALINNDRDIFDNAKGGGIFKDKDYSYILKEGNEYHNLFRDIRSDVKDYFENNKISFWGGKRITPNTLSSQVSCLNHLFLIRYNPSAVKDVMQAFVGDKFNIDKMCKINEDFDCQYIAFEMISNKDRMNEKKLTRGNTCTSIDAIAVAEDSFGEKHVLVIEWKLVEDDSGNKAPKTSKSEKEICRGKTRVERYGELIKNCSKLKGLEICNKEDGFYNSSLFNLPFYELMRQTLWANLNKEDFGAKDYLHIHVVPAGNPMRTKVYNCIKDNKDKKCCGVEDGWRHHLTSDGNERYILVDPYVVVKVLKEKYKEKYENLISYLEKRYYEFE